MLIISCSFIGCIGLMMVKKYGWIFSNAIIMVLIVILSAGWNQLIMYRDPGIGMVLVPLATIVILAALIILHIPMTRNRFIIKRNDYGWLALLTAILAAMFFGLQ